MNTATNLLTLYRHNLNPLPSLRRATGKPVVFTYAGWGEHAYFSAFDYNAEPHHAHYDHITVCYDDVNEFLTYYNPFTRKWKDSEGYEGNF
jgi:hypothetical protein